MDSIAEISEEVIYPYYDESGVLLYEKIRKPGKKFIIQRPDGNGDYLLGKGDNPAVLYKLPGLVKELEHPPDLRRPVHITEGEKDADGLAKFGFLATTAGSSSSWKADYAVYFRYMEVVVYEDNDQAGRVSCDKIIRDLRGIAKTIKRVEFRDMTEGSDVSDWLEVNGNSCAKLLEKIEGAPFVYQREIKEPTTDPKDDLKLKPRILFKPYSDYHLRPPEWVISNFLEADSLCHSFGDPGSGKSLFFLDAAFCIAGGIPFYGRSVKQGAVLFFVCEGLSGVTRRLKALEIKYGAERLPLYITVTSALLSDPEAGKEIIDAIDALGLPNHEIRAVIFDTLSRNFGPGNENSSQDMTIAINNMDAIRNHLGGAAIIPIHHSGKADKDTGRGSNVLRAAADTEYKFDKNSQDKVTVSCMKMKDGDRPEPLAFEIEAVNIGLTDPEGNTVFAPVLRGVEYFPSKPVMRIGQTEIDYLKKIEELKPVNPSLTKAGLVKALSAEGRPRSQSYLTINRLEEKGLITIDSGIISLQSEKTEETTRSCPW